MGKENKSKPVESGQEKFRRVINQRLTPLVKRMEQITNMAGQPSYDPSEKDLALVRSTIRKEYEYFESQFQKWQEGTLKAKDQEKFSGVDWDKELEEGSEEEQS